MKRRALFRSLGLAALVAGVSALPKLPTLPKDVVPEGGPRFSQAPSEPLPEIPWVHPSNDKVDFPTLGAYHGFWHMPATAAYPVTGMGSWTSAGSNTITLTNGANLTISGAAPSHTSGYVQAMNLT